MWTCFRLFGWTNKVKKEKLWLRDSGPVQSHISQQQQQQQEFLFQPWALYWEEEELSKVKEVVVEQHFEIKSLGLYRRGFMAKERKYPRDYVHHLNINARRTLRTATWTMHDNWILSCYKSIEDGRIKDVRGLAVWQLRGVIQSEIMYLNPENRIY